MRKMGDIMNKRISCDRCEYEWIPRVKEPKECPRCKNRLDKITVSQKEVKKLLRRSRNGTIQ